MPPKEPLIYRLFEIVQNYGYAYKAVLNEKFGDGIMSAISFSTKVEKETDEKGDWAVITLRGKWYGSFNVAKRKLMTLLGCHTLGFSSTALKSFILGRYNSIIFHSSLPIEDAYHC